MSEVSVETNEAGDDVTYVAGRAVEQQTSGQIAVGDHASELEAARVAVKKALADDAKAEAKRSSKEDAESIGREAAREAKKSLDKDPLVPKERGADGKFAKSETPDEEDEAPAKRTQKEDPDASALRKALAERREVAKARAEAAASLERERAEVRQYYARIQAQEREVKAERERMALFKKDPVRAIRENGWTNPEEFILDIAQDGTPEGQARRKQREFEQQIQELHDWKRQQAEQAQRQQQEAQLHQQKAYRQQVEREFLTEASKCEHLVGLYQGNEVGLIAQADVVAEQYRNATGKEATFAEIAEYLEERTARWYKSR